MNMQRLMSGFCLVLNCIWCPLQAQQSDAETKQLAIIIKAASGDAQSQYELARIFDLGAIGQAKNPTEAVKWYRKAADQNLAAAQEQLGLSYENGTGVAKNIAEAVKWYRKAAEQNNNSAICLLALCYEKGKGVETNYVEAYKWHLLGASAGHLICKLSLPDCISKMSAEQIAEGKEKAAIQEVVNQLNVINGIFMSASTRITPASGLDGTVDKILDWYQQQLRTMDISKCPQDFRVAFTRYVQGFREFCLQAKKNTGFSGILKGFLNPAAIFKVGSETEAAARPLNDAKNELELICAKYNIKMAN